LDTSEKVNYSRPSIDVSFESAADAFGKSATGILLSGANADGTDGLLAIDGAGGRVIIQSPESAEMPFMPEHAAQHIRQAKIVDMAGIGEILAALDLS
jgi:two-component system chemotaxis response regulator CheB